MGLCLIIGFVKHWIGAQSPPWLRLVPYEDEVEVSHELGGRLARTFGSFDEHGQFFDHRNRGGFLHTDLLTLLNSGFVNESAAPNSSIPGPGNVKNFRLRRPELLCKCCIQSGVRS